VWRSGVAFFFKGNKGRDIIERMRELVSETNDVENVC